MSVYLEKVLRHAERKLVHESHLRPTDLLDVYRRFLKLEEHRLKLEHMHGGGGRELVQKRADVITVMLRHIWEGAWETHRKSHLDKAPRVALLAVGGFGRGELNPYSDIDILFLYANEGAKMGAQVNDIVQHILYMLWDIGFPGRPRHAHDAGAGQPGQRRPAHEDLAAGGALPLRRRAALQGIRKDLRAALPARP